MLEEMREFIYIQKQLCLSGSSRACSRSEYLSHIAGVRDLRSTAKTSKAPWHRSKGSNCQGANLKRIQVPAFVITQHIMYHAGATYKSHQRLVAAPYKMRR